MAQSVGQQQQQMPASMYMAPMNNYPAAQQQQQAFLNAANMPQPVGGANQFCPAPTQQQVQNRFFVPWIKHRNKHFLVKMVLSQSQQDLNRQYTAGLQPGQLMMQSSHQQPYAAPVAQTMHTVGQFIDT